MALRTSVGRNDDTNQGYLFSELINTFRLNDTVTFNLSPKYFFSGVESFAGVGVSSYINLFDNLQLIPEINTSFKNDSDFNSSLALRYSLKPGKSIDLYYSNEKNNCVSLLIWFLISDNINQLIRKHVFLIF
jgi:hypothetical protein